MKHILKLMRPQHYIKNLLVFAALGCSGQLLVPEKLLAGLLGFAAFCMVSSAVYIINDIQDAPKDRLHPVKRSRPIATGNVSVKCAWICAGMLLALGGLLNQLIYHRTSTIFLAMYLLLNLAYSFGLKNIPILDVTILASGFLLRILYGAYITEIVVSNWLYLTVIMLAFYFSLGKRRNELKKQKGGQTRDVLKAYPIGFLDKGMNMHLTLAIAFYALWSMDESTINIYGQYLVFTIPIVLLIVMKYSLAIEGDSDGDPVDVLLHDKILLALCAMYLLFMFLILYF